jgi:hypothetical protein
MRGYPEFNYPLFNDTAKILRKQGNTVFNPAENEIEHGRPIAEYMAIDLQMVCKAEGIAVLPNWHRSEMSRVEVFVAWKLGKQILDAFTLAPIDNEFIEAVMEEFARER